LRAVMPGDQVDAMLSAGRSRATYSPEVAPLLALLKQLAAKPAARDIVVERPGLRIALHAGASL
jgi:oxaloacetate decarboxylase (Na+ extruding) subunit alpha